MENKKHIDSFLALANGLRFKLWAIVGKNDSKKNDVISYLTKTLKWEIIDVQNQLTELYTELDQLEEPSHDVGIRIKEWFGSLPNKIILTNASILYHTSFTKISPIGAFKYNSRNKNCVIFLEEETMISNRLYYGNSGSDEYFDRDINDILISKIDDIEEDYFPSVVNEDSVDFETPKDKLSENAIGRLFNFTEIKDVVDIDTDLQKEDLQKELISSYIISEGLEQQIIDFYDNLKKPNHKAVKILGNYGSGKSHLIAFLVSSITRPDLRTLISNKAVQKACEDVNRNFLTVQFELQPVSVELSIFFFREIEKQVKQKYNIDVPKFTTEIIDFKEHIDNIVKSIKEKEPTAGLLVIIDEVSDFLSTKAENEMNKDFQFLRVVAQECQSQDILVVYSMQEDIYSSPRFKNIAAQAGRIDQRFQNISIRREAVQQVISQRIVPKSANQKADIEEKLKLYAEKIEDVSSKLEQYTELFPFTPFLLNLFDELPYFEKRGVIQFAQSEVKYKLNKSFPYFFTFDKIFDVLENNPNIKNLETVYDTVKVVSIIKQKIVSNLDSKDQEYAVQIVKGLALYSLWSNGHNGATAKELAERLLILPQNKAFEAQMQVSLIVKKIREATDGFYLKVVQDTKTGNDYFKFDPDIDGTDPDERIDTEVNAIGSAEDKLESILFEQIREILDLDYYNNYPNVFKDECIWQSVKSFRKGFIVFSRKGEDIPSLPDMDYYINFISPFFKGDPKKIGSNQLNINLNIPGQQSIEHLKRIVAIRSLINKNVLSTVMNKKLSEEIEGTRTAGITKPGIKFKISRWVFSSSETILNDKQINIKHELGKEYNNLSEMITELKKKIFDNCFNNAFPEHPKYSQIFTSYNINDSLTRILDELVDGNFTRTTQNTKAFLSNLTLLNENGDIDISGSKIAQFIYSTIADKKGKMVNIQSELEEPLKSEPYGLEPQIVHFYLVILTILGRVSLKAKGGDEIDLANIKDKYRSISQFENIVYTLKKEDLSYDFASRLLNALGLNGNLILKENSRNEAFKEYKLKVKEINDLIMGLNTLIDHLKNRTNLFISISDLIDYYEKTQVIDWGSLDISNHAKFKELEHLNKDLKNVTDSLINLENLKQAIQFYNETVHEGTEYMSSALEIIKNNKEFLNDDSIYSKLEEFYTDTRALVKDFSKFIRLDERFPIEGKINAFKESYIKDFYFPAHEKTIGRKVDWKSSIDFENNSDYRICIQLAQLDCNVNAKIFNQINEWNHIKELSCTSLDISSLYKIPFHTTCNFLKEQRDYSKVNIIAGQIDKRLADIKEEYTKTAISEIQKNKDQLDIAKIDDTSKKKIRKIIEVKRFPDNLDSALIESINELFKNIEIISIKKSEILNALFKENELLTKEQFKEALFNLESSVLKRQTGDDVRIKFEED